MKHYSFIGFFPKAILKSSKGKIVFDKTGIGCLVVIISLIIAYNLIVKYPRFFGGNTRGYNSMANAYAKNAYSAAQAYFKDHPKGIVALPLLKKYGFVQSKDIEIRIISGTKSELKISSGHLRGNKTWTIDAEGKFTSSRRERKLFDEIDTISVALILSGVLFAIICHGFSKKIIKASFLSAILSCISVIVISVSINPEGLFGPIIVILFFPYFVVSLLIGLIYAIIRRFWPPSIKLKEKERNPVLENNISEEMVKNYKICPKCGYKYKLEKLTCDNCGCTYLEPVTE